MGRLLTKLRVVGLYLGLPGKVESVRVEKIELSWEGLVGDRHYGITKPAGGREIHWKMGTIIRNNRQWSAVSVEELERIAIDLRVDEIKPEWLGANLCLRGVLNLTKLPPNTELTFPSQASLMVYQENEPCVFPGHVIQRHYPDIPDLAMRFKPVAEGYRGLVGWVQRIGEIRTGDEVAVRVP